MNVPRLRFSGFEGEWEEIKLGDLVDFKNGLNYLKSDRGETVYTVGVKNFNQKKLRSTLELETINLSSIPNKDFLLNKDDLLFVRSNGNKELVGRMMWVENELLKTYYSGFVIRGRIKERTDLEPLFLLSLESKIKGAMKTLTGGTNISNLSQSILSSLVLNVPSIEEQNKIASFIALIEQKVEKQQEKIEKLEQFKKGMMQKIFSQEFRFKDEDGGEFGEWEKGSIGQVFKERSERGNPEFELLAVTINSGVMRRSEIEKKDSSSENKDNYKTVYPNDLVYNSMRMWQGASGVSKYKGIVSPAYTILSPVNDVSSDYFSYLFKTKDMIQVFQSNSQGLTSDTWNLKYPALSKIKINIPSYREQEKVAAHLDRLDTKIEKEKEKLMVLEEQRKGFMQGMFV